MPDGTLGAALDNEPSRRAKDEARRNSPWGYELNWEGCGETGMTMKFRSANYEFQWGEQHSMISAEYWVDAHGPYAFQVPKVIDFLIISEQSYLDTYASVKMLKQWRLLSKGLLKFEQQKALIDQSRQARQRYFRFFRAFQKISIARIDNTALLKLLSTYILILKEIARYFVVSQPEGIDAVTATLGRTLAKKKASHLLSVLITPTTPDIIFKEQAALQKLSANKVRTVDALLNHARTYAWLFFNSYDVHVNLKFLKIRLGESFDTQAKLREMAYLKKRQRVIFRGIGDRRVLELCFFLQHLSIVRLELKDCWGGAEYRFLSLFQEIAKRIQVPFDVMMATYRFEDYHGALLAGQKLSQDAVAQRKKSFLFWKRGSEISFIERPMPIRQIVRSLRGKIHAKKVSTLHGVPASPGKTAGRARLVQSTDINQLLKDLKRFRKGDILVTWMTQPNMVPIARKASAIIADEGGITSHAAVIARELKIPCIVGVKYATKVLHDGDEIEVDADLGIVRILK